MATLLDNRGEGTVGYALADHLTSGSSLSILSNSMSLYAYNKLAKKLNQVQRVRILLSPSPLVQTNEDDPPFFPFNLQGSQVDRRLRNRLDTPYLANRLGAWLEKKAEVRLLQQPMPQNLICLENKDQTLAIHGAASFDTQGLGFAPSSIPQLNTMMRDKGNTEQMLAWFEGLWQDAQLVQDYKDELLAGIKELHRHRPSAEVYYAVLHHLFSDILADFDEDKIVRTQTGITDTVIWSKLYGFQRDAVIGAIDKIEKYNGCIIADSVGLGKTFEALGVIKYYELRNDRVLVLCPKRLRENWTIYTVNDRRNLFAADRFNYDVLNHTDLTRTSGFSGEINLETLNWGNYDLVVIDESHNFRNQPSSDGMTRYGRLMDDIIKSGVKTKVLMLSATPVNNRMNDLKNQLAFITEGDDWALHRHGIKSIEQTLRRAQMRFNQWLRLSPEERTTEELLRNLNFGYFKLLDLMTIARSRKHIIKYYDPADTGDFPRRNQPINIKAGIDRADGFPALQDINRDIRRLNLSTYSPLKYVLLHKRDEYSRKYDKTVAGGSVFKQVDREQSLIHLMRVNLLKRMESSIHSFTLTVGRLLQNVRDLLAALDTFDDEAHIEEISITDIEVDEEEFAPYLVGSKIKVLLQDVDRRRWRQDLREDEALLERLLRAAQQVDASRDEKLRRLKEELRKKIEQPFNLGNKKALIFTAFTDTADYLYEHLSDWASKQLGLHSALVTGASSTNKTTMPGIRKDMGSILTSFSPLSMEREKVAGELAEEIDILIATDCISEGQNLQDCDYVVNYDIHWNPVRIIQRFGRIDRFGSPNELIQLVNFWPNLELDEYIDLEARVSGRMVLLDISATGEENVIESTDHDQMNDLQYRRRQLEQLQQEIVDLEDLSTGVSITDLTLNDFRMDLVEQAQEGDGPQGGVPLGLVSVTEASFDDGKLEEPGIVFCLRDASAQSQVDEAYTLAPYYLVHVLWDGQVKLGFEYTRKTLDLLRAAAVDDEHVDEAAYARFAQMTENFSKMDDISQLLAKAVQAVTGEAAEQGVQSLFQRGGTLLEKQSFQGIDDFEVIAYLVILEPTAKVEAKGSG